MRDLRCFVFSAPINKAEKDVVIRTSGKVWSKARSPVMIEIHDQVKDIVRNGVIGSVLDFPQMP